MTREEKEALLNSYKGKDDLHPICPYSSRTVLMCAFCPRFCVKEERRKEK